MNINILFLQLFMEDIIPHKQGTGKAARLNIMGLKAPFSICMAAYLHTNYFSLELFQSPSRLYSQYSPFTSLCFILTPLFLLNIQDT